MNFSCHELLQYAQGNSFAPFRDFLQLLLVDEGRKNGWQWGFYGIGSGEQGLVQFEMRIQCGIKFCRELCSKLNGVSFT